MPPPIRAGTTLGDLRKANNPQHPAIMVDVYYWLDLFLLSPSFSFTLGGEGSVIDPNRSGQFSTPSITLVSILLGHGIVRLLPPCLSLLAVHCLCLPTGTAVTGSITGIHPPSLIVTPKESLSSWTVFQGSSRAGHWLLTHTPHFPQTTKWWQIVRKEIMESLAPLDPALSNIASGL